MQSATSITESDEKEEVPIGDLLYKFLPYWPVFVLLLMFSVAGAWLYLRYTSPVYQTTASILIKDDKKGAGALDPLEAFDLFGGKKSVENEVEILQSKTLIQEVVNNLHLYAPLTDQGRVANSNAYLTSPIVIEARAPDSMKFVRKIPFDFDEQTKTVKIDDKYYHINEWVKTSYGLLRFLPNKYFRPLIKTKNSDKEKSHFYFSLNSLKSTANGILKDMIITPSSKQSTVIDLTIEGEVPQRGEDVLNELLKVYNQAAILDKNILAANTLQFVKDRLAYVVNELDSVEGSLEKYKTKNKIFDISAQSHIFLETVAANDQKLSELNMQSAVLDQVQSYVKGNGNIGGIAPATFGLADPVLTGLLSNLSELELQYEKTKKIVPENNPVVISLVDAIEKLKPGILANINSQRRNLAAAKENLSVTNTQFNSMLKTIPEKERELLGISRQQSIKNNIYTFLLQKREETALSFASAVADSRIIDKAESSDIPVSPKKYLIYLASILGAFALGFSFIYAKDMLNRTVKDRSDIEKYTSIPFLGEVVFDRSKSPIVISDGKRSFIAEQFRQLRTSLSYLGIDESHKRILITSSISGEGKSFIASNLGASLALMNKKVVLIELDLRKPKLSDYFSVSRNIGISNYLIGKLPIDEIIKITGIEYLSIIPSGPIPPNPSELISNGRLNTLLDDLESKFDYIIIDTAPVSPVTDAYLVSPICDVTLFVIRHDYTPKMFVQKLEQQNKKSSLTNPAIVYNGIRGKGIGKYRYGNGYGYGYGYTENEDNTNWWKNIFKKK
ncbi:MAG: polysaccharide biosynthesis tyrosine autokinase [Ginsengibacter sp.]